ncbi:unnamed protein product [Lota lota]
MALVSLMVSPRWRLVLMLLAIYNFNLSTATKCNGHAVAELHEEVLQFNETAKQDFGNVKYQKCKQKPTPMEFQQHLQALSVQLNNLARVNVRQRT